MPYRRVGYAEQIWYILYYKFMEVMHMPRKPKKPKKPCSYPGCPELTDGRYCEKHQKQENARYEKYDRDPAVRRMPLQPPAFLMRWRYVINRISSRWQMPFPLLPTGRRRMPDV